MRSFYEGAGEGQHRQKCEDDEVDDRGGDDGGIQLRGACVIHTYGDEVWTSKVGDRSDDDDGVQLQRAYLDMHVGDMEIRWDGRQ